jgi:hypothetical protein
MTNPAVTNHTVISSEPIQNSVDVQLSEMVNYGASIMRENQSNLDRNYSPMTTSDKASTESTAEKCGGGVQNSKNNCASTSHEPTTTTTTVITRKMANLEKQKNVYK